MRKIWNRAYIVLFFVNLTISISFTMLSTTVALYTAEMGIEVSLTGIVIGAMSIASLCMRPFTGIICDRFSRKALLVISLIIIAGAVLGCSMTRNISLLITFRILHGIGFSMATTITMALVSGTLSEDRMTQGLGYFALGQTIAMAIAPSIGLYLGEKFGYPKAFQMAALLIGVAAVFSFILIDNKPFMKKHHGFDLHDFFACEALPFAILAIVVSGCTGLENGYVASYGLSLSIGTVGWYFTLGAVALFMARVLGGKLSDRHPWTISAALSLMAAAFLILGGVAPLAGKMGAIICFGVAALFKALGLGTVQPALQARSMNSVPDERRGAASCTYYLGTDIGQATAPIAGGVLISAIGYSKMFLAAAIVVLAASFISYYFICKQTQKRS